MKIAIEVFSIVIAITLACVLFTSIIRATIKTATQETITML